MCTYVYIYISVCVCSILQLNSSAITSPQLVPGVTYFWAQALHVGEVHDHIGCGPEIWRHVLSHVPMDWMRTELVAAEAWETTFSTFFNLQTSLNRYVASSFSHHVRTRTAMEGEERANQWGFRDVAAKTRCIFSWTNRYVFFQQCYRSIQYKGSNMICKALYANMFEIAT